MPQFLNISNGQVLNASKTYKFSGQHLLNPSTTQFCRRSPGTAVTAGNGTMATGNMGDRGEVVDLNVKAAFDENLSQTQPVKLVTTS